MILELENVLKDSSVIKSPEGHQQIATETLNIPVEDPLVSLESDTIINKEKSKPSQPNKSEVISTEKAAVEFDINSIDLRVGIIVKVSKHETAEKLYCEEIDIGEDKPRAIASGLVKHYTLDEMLNKKVIVVANLKPRTLVGFKSNGMVLCAVKDNEDGSEIVELISPPEAAKPGDRIIGKGLTGAPLSASQCDKKKVFEKIAPGLKLIDGVAYWNDVLLVTENGDAITATKLKDGVLR